jgi:hypothetical protein
MRCGQWRLETPSSKEEMFQGRARKSQNLITSVGVYPMRTNATRDPSATPSEDSNRIRKRGRPTGDHAAKSREFIEAARHVIAHYGYAAASL